MMANKDEALQSAEGRKTDKGVLSGTEFLPLRVWHAANPISFIATSS